MGLSRARAIRSFARAAAERRGFLRVKSRPLKRFRFAGALETALVALAASALSGGASWTGLVVLAALALSCGAPPPDPERPLSLLLISMDTARFDHMHFNGYARATTPSLDRLAARGTRFTRAWAHSPWTLPSHATMLSGQLPFRSGVVDDDTMIGPSVPLIAPILKARGYATAGVVSGFYVSSRFGFQRGFERFEDFGLPAGARPRDSVRAQEVTQAALQVIAGAGDRPFFVFAHYFDAHNNYDPPAPWNRAFDDDTKVVPYQNYAYYREHPLDPAAIAHIVAEYDEEILYADAMIGRLLDGLERSGRGKDTLIVFTSDHGEEFFEHGSWGHGNSLYTQVLRVPLVFAGPGLRSGAVSDAFVRHTDLTPTILDLLGGAPAVPPGAVDGRSYAGLLRARGADSGGGASAPPPLLADTSRFDVNLLGWVVDSHALIRDFGPGGTQLYDLASDPEERRDLAPSAASSMETLASEMIRAAGSASADHWSLAWEAGRTGCARATGVVLTEGGAASRLLRFGPAAGSSRFALVPPDATIDVWVADGAGAACGWSESGDPIPGADRRGRSVSVSAVRDGARLRDPQGVGVAGKDGAAVRIRIASTSAPAAPTNLTPEEQERLRSLGYLH